MSATIHPPASAAEELHRRQQTPAERVHHALHAHPFISPLIVLLLAMVVFTSVNDRFIQPGNLSLILQQVAVVGLLAVGQTLIILTAGIDLSVGAIMVLSSLVMAKLAADGGVPGVLALLIGIGVGALAGLINGLLVTRLALPPFIVTLGTLNVFIALALLYAGGQSISGDRLPGLLTWTGKVIRFGDVRITTGVFMVLGIAAVIAFALTQTGWGRHVYAVGDDAEAARLAGISVQRVLLSVYVVAGFIFAITAWVQIGRSYNASPNAAVDANLDSITAVVIGGTSLFGGRGAIIGTLLGALTVGVFRNGLALAGVDVLYQTLVVGVLVIAAVSIDQWIRKVRS